MATSNERSLSTLSRAITLSERHFSLILVRCNYAAKQEQMRHRLQELCDQRLRELVLPQSINTLFTTILTAIAPTPAIKAGENEESLSSVPPPGALMVFGLESVTAIDQVLISTNQVRDEFRKSLNFPLVLWVTDEVLQKLTRFAPDFKSWAASSIKFELSTAELIALWRQMASELFATVLAAGVGQFLTLDVLDLAPGCRRRQELEFALRDLQTRGVTLEPPHLASWQFVLGRDAYANDQIDSAIAFYQQSLGFWQQSVNDEQPTTDCGQKGVLLFHIGLCYCRKADLQPGQSLGHWESARHYFQQAVAVFEQQGLLDSVAHAIFALGEVLKRLEAWTDLQALAQQSLLQPQTYNSPVQLAQAKGFLAEVASFEGKWVEACELANTALSLLAQSPEPQHVHRGSYLLILAASERRLGLVEAALHHLKLAQEETQPQARRFKPQVSPQLYLDILEDLRSLYFDLGYFSQAFELKQEQQSIRQQYGFCTFLGAAPLQPHRPKRNRAESGSPITTQGRHSEATHAGLSTEIAAAGRQQDVNRLIERLSRNDHKLTVIHGASGVGKSSLINAGLVPALKGSILGAREAIPVVLQVYTDWVAELGRRLAQELSDCQFVKLSSSNLLTNQPDNLPTILEQLRQNAERNLLTVLIFDQFEEFFFVCTTLSERQRFYDFFRHCLNLPYVKVILSLREDYLHFLLECDRFCNLDAINNNILDKSMRYYLQDLSPQDATSVIHSLTERSQFYLEPALISQFVRDLAGEKGAVRLIELQVMGAQLQAEHINTLEQYQQLGSDPLSELVKRSLQDVITDCGVENEDAVWSVLFSLTNEKGTRPLKTKPELAKVHNSLFIASGHEQSTLDLILNILVGSGLVLRVPEEPENRYQLVHDYLVEPIREAYEWRAQLNMAAELTAREQELFRVRKQKLRAVTIGVLMAILAIAAAGLAWRSETLRKRAFVAETNAYLRAMSASSEALFASHKHFDALIESLRAARLMRVATGVEPDIRAMVVTALEQSVYGEKELNRLEGHSDVVWHVCFSPDGKTLASSSRDQSVRVWSIDGTNLAILKGHQDSVTSVSFSPDGQMIASASWDKTVRLWRRDGRMLRILRGHQDHVFSVSFSPDGKSLASASQDGTVKLWTVEGSLIKTLSGHQGGVTWVSFSPDGQMIASAGEDTVKLWDRTGKLLTTLNGHTGKVNYVSFSRDGRTIASASDDKTVKLWERTGKLLTTLQGHQKWVFSVSFSPDGETLASASDDNTVRIWSRTGRLIKTLQGHGDRVTAVSFSPDGQMIASASYDKTVKLWKSTNTPRTILRGHTEEVIDVTFSPDGQMMASASKDNTVNLWKRTPQAGMEAVLYKTLNGHTDWVTSVSFSPDGQLLASASRDKTVKLWSRTGKLIKTLIGHNDWVLGVRFSPNGQLIASASRDKTVKLWSLTGALIKTLIGHGDRVNAVTFSPDGTLLASASDDNTVKIWSVGGRIGTQARLIQTLKGHSNWVLDVSFRSDGLLLASASYDNTVKLWRRTKGRSGLEIYPYRTLKGPTDSVAHVSFSPDGQVLATTSWDNRVQLWRIDDTLIKNLEGHSSRVTSASFSPDGKRLASASNDNTVILWNLDLDDLVKRSCSQLHDYLLTNPKVRKSDRHLCD